jgi:hypothetical protein
VNETVDNAEAIGIISILLIFIAIADPAECFLGSSVSKNYLHSDAVFQLKPF